MMRKYLFIGWAVWMVVILGIISSCSQDKGTSRLAWGKYYLWSAPDSSYRILNAIPFPDKLSVEEQACYALLMTQAMYRCGHKISSDFIDKTLLYSIILHKVMQMIKLPLCFIKDIFLEDLGAG